MDLLKNLLMLVFLVLSNWKVIGQTSVIPVDLKCEYQTSPLNIDFQNPRLSWRLEGTKRGSAQSGYQIRVSSDSTLLKKGGGDIWNTAKVISSQSNAINNDGKPLKSLKQYYWRVIVWDQDVKGSIPSAIACWETGMFGITDWKGSWISDGKDTAFKPAPYLRKTFLIERKIKNAKLLICGLAYYEFSLNGRNVGDLMLDPGFTRYDKTDLYVSYDVTKYIRQGKNAAGVILGNGWYHEQSYATWYFHKAPWRERPRLLLN